MYTKNMAMIVLWMVQGKSALEGSSQGLGLQFLGSSVQG